MSDIKQNTMAIPMIPTDTKFWFVRAGANATYFDDFYLNNYIGVETFHIQKQEIPEGTPINEKSTVAKYKEQIQKNLQTFKNQELKKIYPDDSPENKQKLDEAIKQSKRSVSISAGRKANTLFKFWHSMTPNDFIITPGFHSNVLLLGIILDEPNYPVTHSTFTNEKGEKINYAVSPYEGKKIFWIKKIKFKDLPDSARFIKHGNGAIFDVTENMTDLLSLIFPIYVYQESIYTRLNVASPEHHTSSQIYRLQSVFEHTKVNQSADYIQKTDISCPGHVILQTALANSDSILNILHTLGIGGIAVPVTLIACSGIKYLSPAINSRFSNGAKYDREQKKTAAAKEKEELEQIKSTAAHNQKMNELEEKKQELANEAQRLQNQQLRQALNSAEERVLVTADQTKLNFDKISKDTKANGHQLTKELKLGLDTPSTDD